MQSRDILKWIRRWGLIVLGVWLLLPAQASAQGEWDVSLSLNPFPSPYISDWENNPTAVGQATIFNNSDEAQEVILFVTLFKSDIGQLVESESARVIVESLATRTVNNTEFIEFSSADYTNASIEEQVFRTGRLPEGTYTGCVQVRNRSGANLSSPVCREFEIVYPDPPQLISPANGDEVSTEFPTFQWIPVNVPADYDIFYTLKIVEILDTQTPLRALEANVPLLERSDVTSTTFTYPLDGLAFEEETSYAWQVQAVDQFGLAPASNQGRSEIFTFEYGPAEEDTTGDEPVAATTSAEPCGGECLAEEPTGSPSDRSFSAGDELQIGHFVLTLTDASGTGADLSGEGEIQVPFLNDVRISVAFENLTVSDDGVVISGRATATEDIPSVTWSDVESTVSGSPVSVPSPTPEQAEVFHDIFEGGERVVSALTGDRTMGMPLGFSSSGTGDIGYTVGITRMVFNPRQASLNAMLTFDIPSLGDKMIALGSNEICFTPAGLGEQGNLYLAEDWEIVQEGGIRFAMAGLSDASGDTSSVTYARWDCEGFDCVQVRGFVEFPEDKLIKEDETGGTIAGPVTGDFSFKTCDGRNFLAQIEMDPFRVSGMSGWGFRVEDAWLDFSDTENPTDFTLPENYEDPDLSDPRFETTWTGFYLELAELHAPGGFEDRSVDGRARVGVHDLIIDGTGLTASIRAEDLIDYDDGNVEGWAFSLDAVELNILQNSFESGELNGGLGLPISADRLDYSSTLSITEDDEIHYDFIVSAGTDGYSVNAWKAELNLDAASNIIFEYDESDESSTHLTATLHGNLGLQADGIDKVPGLNFTEIPFENLLLSTEEPYFDVGDSDIENSIFGFASPQKEASGFPVTISDINLVKQGGSLTKPGLQFTTQLNLTEDIAADLTFSIYGDLAIPGAGERFDFNYHETNLEAIHVHANLKSVEIDGNVLFYEDSSKEGVYGDLSVTLPIGVTADMEAEFGKSYEEGGFRYWYVYGLVTFPSGIDIFSGFALYGLGGGVYHNMTNPPDDSIRQPITVSTGGGERNPEPVREESSAEPGSIYEPDKGTFLGIKVQAIMGVKGEEKAFNMDVILEAEVASARGGGSRLQSLVIRGKGQVMTDINEEDPSSPVEVDVNIEFQNRPPDKFIDGNIGIKINLKDIIYGCGEDYAVVNAQFHADFSDPRTETVGEGKQWWFYIGEMHPGRRACLKLDLKIVEATLESYFMVGTKVPSGLPPLPPAVESLLGGDGGEDRYEDSGGEVTTRANTSLRGEIEEFRPGKGFATGAHFHAGADITFIIVYASLDAWAGFDFNLVQQTGRCVETGKRPGINGYYGQGQVYVALEGEVGIKVNLWFVKKKVPFLYLGAAAQMAGKLPDPNWFMGRVGLRYSVLGGLISGHTNMKVEFGEECTLMSDFNPFAGIEFIDRIEPEQDKKVDVYTNPTAYFNLEINKILAIPNGEESDDPGGITEYQPFIEDFTLTNLETGVTDRGSYELQKDGLVANYTIGRDLEGVSDYTSSITIRAWELLRDGGRELVEIPDTVIDGEPAGPWRTWEETKEVEFTTLAEPTELQEDQIVYSYPVKRQNFFLKGEVSRNEGVIRLKNPVAGLFDNYLDLNQDGEDQENERYQDYYAKFINVKTGDIVERELNYDASGSTAARYITLPLPSELENETFYALQIVARKRPQPVTVFAMPVEEAGEEEKEDRFGDLRLGGIQDILGETSKYADAISPQRMGYAIGDEFYATTVEVGKAIQKLPGKDVGEREHLIYSYYFGTSKYNTLEEKTAGITFTPEHHTFGNLDYFKLRTTLDEPFDTFDLNGVFKDGRQVLRPLVLISTDPSGEYGESIEELYDYYDDLRRTSPYRLPLSEVTGSYIDEIVNIPIPVGRIDYWGYGMPPLMAVYPASENMVLGALSDLKMKDEAGLIPESVQESFWYRAFSEALGGQFRQLSLRYDVSMYVKLHASRLKNSVSRFLSSNTARYAFDNTRFLQATMPQYDNGWQYQREHGDVWPTFSELMFRESPYLLGRSWWLLFKDIDDFSLQSGRYNVTFRYRIPGKYGSMALSPSERYIWFTYNPVDFLFDTNWLFDY